MPSSPPLQTSNRVQLDIEAGPAQGRNFDLTNCPVLIIGRDGGIGGAEVTLALPDSSLSRRHLRFTASADSLFFFLEDLDSTNGTYLNGRLLKAKRTVRLVTGDLIKAGNTRLRFTDTRGTELQNHTGREKRLAEVLEQSLLENKQAQAAKINTRTPSVNNKPLQPEQTIAQLTFELKTGEIWIEQKKLKLSGKQYYLFYYLYQHRERVCNFTELIEYIWRQKTGKTIFEAGLEPTPAHVHQLVREIRRKIDQLNSGFSGESIISSNSSLRGYRLIIQ